MGDAFVIFVVMGGKYFSCFFSVMSVCAFYRQPKAPKHSISKVTGFDLMTRYSYCKILIEVFTKHILAENTYFTNHKE